MERRQTSTSADAMKALLQRRLEAAQVNQDTVCIHVYQINYRVRVVQE